MINLRNRICLQVQDQAWRQVLVQFQNHDHTQIWEQVWEQVWDRVRHQIQDQVWNQIWNQVFEQTDVNVED